jgi:hypothetical protein
MKTSFLLFGILLSTAAYAGCPCDCRTDIQKRAAANLEEAYTFGPSTFNEPIPHGGTRSVEPRSVYWPEHRKYVPKRNPAPKLYRPNE